MDAAQIRRNKRIARGTRWTAALLPAAVLVALSAPWGPTRARGQGPTPDREGEAEQVDQFLGRLGLLDLQILHLEQTLDRLDAGTKRDRLGRRLADLYAERLVTAADDPQLRADLMARVEALLAAVPEANTPTLKVMLLQGDFIAAEARMLKWLDDPRDTESHDAALAVLERIAPELNGYRNDLKTAAEELLNELDDLSEQARQARQPELSRLRSAAGRAAFFAGWSNYYLALADREKADDSLAMARSAFRSFLGIDYVESYDEVEVEWLGLEVSLEYSRALIGLGLVEAAAGHLADSRKCFALFEHANAPPAMRDQAAYWYLRGLLNAGAVDQAAQYAGELVPKLSGEATQGTVSFCDALVRAGFGGGSSSPEARRLGRLGIEGLVRQRQFDLLRQLMAKYGIEPQNDDGFYLVWVKGQQQYFDAAKNSSMEGYGEAVATLRAALSDPQAAKDLAAAGRCRYLLGWCLFRLEQREQAARQFEQAADALRGSGEKDAVDSAWMAFVCFKELADAESARVGLAIDSLEKLQRDYPNSEQAGRADFLLARLRKAAASLDESIASLEAIDKGDKNYLSARYELCLLYHQRWVKQRDDPRRGDEAASQLRAAIDSFLTAAKGDEAQRRLRCLLLGVDVALGGQSPDESAAGRYLELAEPLAAAMPAESSLSADYHYRALQLARRQNDTAAQERHAAWLAENAGDSSYALASLIVLARAADQAVADSQGDARRDRVEEAADVYTRLVARLGNTTEAITAERNARAANSKLAEYEFDLGRYDEAARRLDVLLAAFPDQQDYLRRAGLAHFRAGQFEAALACWRTLLAGVPANSTDWYEAKYYQLSCLARVDRDQARKVYQQLRLLHPEIADPTWRDKLDELGKSLGG